MRHRTSTIVLALLLIACNQSRLDRAIFAVDAAPAVFVTLHLPALESRCANELLTGVSNALHDLKSNPSAEQWQVVVKAVGRFKTSECIHNPRIVEIAEALQRIVNDIPAPTPSLTGRAKPPDFNKVSEADLKELERLTKQ